MHEQQPEPETVKELIDVLQTYPEDWYPYIVRDGGGGYWLRVYDEATDTDHLVWETTAELAYKYNPSRKDTPA